MPVDHDGIDVVDCDLLIVGSGFAGLWAAISARSKGVKRIAIADKGAIGLTSQSKMAAGATIFCLPQHRPDEWLDDMARANSYLSRQDILSLILETSYSRLRKLESWGIEYMRLPGGGYFTLPSRGFERARMLVVPKGSGSRGGSAVVRAMLRQVKAPPDFEHRVDLYPRKMITGITVRGGRAVGAVGVDRRTAEPIAFRSRAVILAGADCSFRGNYLCVDQVTGDAFKLAYDTGVRLNNMEFLVSNTGSPRYGFEGTGMAARFASFLDRDLQPFMKRYHPRADSAEIRYIVQAMADQLLKGNGPPFFFDMSSKPSSYVIRVLLERIGNMVPLNLERLKEMGVDVFRGPQEWVPAVHSLRGGIRTGTDCMSDLPGLFAAGLSQSVDPGLFNGWSSMRAMWSGERSGEAAAAYIRSSEGAAPDPLEERELAVRALGPLHRGTGVDPDDVCAALQRAIFPYGVSVYKDARSLSVALREVERLRDELVPALRAEDPHQLVKVHETANMVAVAELYLRVSLIRQESRADHFRADFPSTDNESWLAWINVRREPDGSASFEREDVPLERYPFGPDATRAGIREVGAAR